MLQIEPRALEVPVLLLVGIYVALLAPSVESRIPPNSYVVAAQATSISGHVADASGNALADLQVELLNDAESVIQRTKTDSAGRFVFQRLSLGIFQIRVQTYGTTYISQTKRVQLERTRMFEQVDFSLASKKGSSTNPTGVVFVQEVPENARKEYQRGATLIQKDDRKEGIAALKKAIDYFPNYFDALELLGTEYVKNQEFEEAVPLLTKAVEVNNSAYQSWNSLGVAQYNLKQIDQAVESMRRAVSLNQKSATANFWMGMLLRLTKKLDQAETYLKQADQLAGAKSSDVKWQLALLYNQLQKYAESANELELFLKLQPDSRDKEQIEKLIKTLRQKSGGSK